MNLTISWQSAKKMIWCKEGSIISRRSTSKFNVKVESQKIKKIKLLKKWEATLSNNARYCLIREKTFVATSESPVTEWAIAIAHSALGELAPNPQNLPPTIPQATTQASVWSQDNALTALGWRWRSSHRISSRSSSRLIWPDIAATLRGFPRTFRRLRAQQPDRSLRAVFFNCC